MYCFFSVSMCDVFVTPVCVLVFPTYIRSVGYMKDVISEFNSEIEGSHLSCALMICLCSNFYVYIKHKINRGSLLY